MFLRHTPVSVISEALKLCESAGINVSIHDFESHYLCGKDPVELAKGLVWAKELGIKTSFLEMSGALLSGVSVDELISRVTQEHHESWDTYSPEHADLIRGYTKDGVEVFAIIDISYNFDFRQAAFGFNSQNIQERISAAVSVFINTTMTREALDLQRSAHEAKLRALAINLLPYLKSLTLTYKTQTSART